MSSPIGNVTQAPAAAQATAVPPKAQAPAAKAQQTPTDTVQISSAAQTISQEIQETRAQTVQEAAKGDNQARRLLAKEDAAAQVTQK
jgi:hypothetical protein